MARGSRLRHHLAAALLALGAVSGCASSGTLARPAAFPTAPVPASIRPELVEIPRPFTFSEVVRTAFALAGTPYRTGGDAPGGFDCSGFVQYVFGQNHVALPRTVIEQFAIGSKVNARDVRVGDLVFFSTVAPGASHVGLAIDGQRFIHAPADGGVVRVERLDAPYWHDRLVGIRRLL